MKLRLHIFALLCLNACGPSAFERGFRQAAKKQYDLDNQSLALWARGPATDADGLELDAQDNLELVNRANVSIPNVLDVYSDLESEHLVIFESTANVQGPIFFEWAGKRVPWARSEFQSFMAYAHFSKAWTYVADLFPDTDLDFEIQDGAALKTKLTVFSAEEGDSFATGYVPSEKSIYFYKETQTPYEAYNAVDEADVIYHEFGHMVQHALNESATFTFPEDNPELNALQEGLSDILAAAIVRDDEILEYSTINGNRIGIIQGGGGRLGDDYNRKLTHTAYFPDGYRDMIHLDGSIVAAALNDFRKYLEGEAVTKLSNCTGATCNLSVRTSTLSTDEAWDTVFVLAYAAFADLSTQSGYQRFAELLISKCGNASLALCPTSATTVLASILEGRGFYFSGSSSTPIQADADMNPDPPNGFLFGSDATYAIQVDQALGYIPYPNSASVANTNGLLDPCELVYIFPKITNKTLSYGSPTVSHPAILTDIEIELGSVTGFTPLTVAGGGVVDPIEAREVNGVTAYRSKVFSTLLPQTAESSFSMISGNSSRWFTLMNSTYFTRPLSSTYLVPDVGWLVKAPSTRGATASAQFRITFRVQNADIVRFYSSDIDYIVSDQWIMPDGVNLPSVVVDSNTANPTFCSQ